MDVKKIKTELMKISSACISIVQAMNAEVEEGVVVESGNSSNEDLNDLVHFERPFSKKFLESKERKEEIIMQKGSISKRKDGRWMGRFRDQDGKVKCVYAPTKYECAYKLKEGLKGVEKDRNSGIMSKMSFGEWLDYWFENSYKIKVKENTFSQSQYVIGLLKEKFNVIINKPLSKVNERDAIEITNKMPKGYVNRMFALLKECFTLALNSGHCRINPFAIINKPKEEKIVSNASTRLSNEEVEKLLYYLKNYYANDINALGIRFLLHSGLRVGELFGLKWSDVDFDKNKIKIERQLNFTTNKITSPKTSKGVRVLPLFKPLKEILNEINPTDDFIFQPYSTYRKFTHFYELACKKTNVECDKVHGLRKTFISICYEKGIDPKVVQNWVGHESINTTLDIYTKLSNEYVESNIDLFD